MIFHTLLHLHSSAKYHAITLAHPCNTGIQLTQEMSYVLSAGFRTLANHDFLRTITIIAVPHSSPVITINVSLSLICLEISHLSYSELISYPFRPCVSIVIHSFIDKLHIIKRFTSRPPRWFWARALSSSATFLFKIVTSSSSTWSTWYQILIIKAFYFQYSD